MPPHSLTGWTLGLLVGFDLGLPLGLVGFTLGFGARIGGVVLHVGLVVGALGTVGLLADTDLITAGVSIG